ncbi:hypothetical protein GTQ43_39405 [Nostoc sp. KVJ3]|nr:hypothetical protein [Nostoc sp. KVJ3]
MLPIPQDWIICLLEVFKLQVSTTLLQVNAAKLQVDAAKLQVDAAKLQVDAIKLQLGRKRLKGCLKSPLVGSKTF